MKVKIVTGPGSSQSLTKKINEFVLNKKIIDMKLSTAFQPCHEGQGDMWNHITVLIMYEE